MDAPLGTALALLVVFSGITALERRRHAGMQPSPSRNEGTSASLGAFHGSAMLAGIVFPWLGIGRLGVGEAVAWVAASAMVAAYALQMWSMTTLGAFFTLTLRATPDQPVVDSGPYRWVRHPGYLGQILTWLAFAIATRNAVAILAVVIGAPLAYGHRIRVEERMLRDTLGDRYDAYARGRAHLVPGLW